MRSVRLRAALAGAILAVAVTPVAAQAHRHHGSLGEKTSKELRKEITAQRMFKHAEALQMIADENGGNRASGFQGYGASVQYVLTKLRDAGYRPTTQVFDFVTFEETADPVLREVSPTAKTYTHGTEFLTMNYSASGDTGVATITPVDLTLSPTPAQRVSTSGCEAADFAGFPAGNIALMQRGSCPFAQKVTNAQAAGAVRRDHLQLGHAPATRAWSPARWARRRRTASPRRPTSTIPAVGISYAEGDRLASEADPTTGQIIVDAKSDQRKSTNILADTRSGNPDNVTIVGSHLDSVPEGPGINDNGSGSAFNLELALQIGQEARSGTENRVRFAFWGAEESGLVGATRYVAAISDEEFAKIAANLNFDMLASPNHGKFVYDGDFSHTPPPATAPNVNPGAAYIESVFLKYFNSVRDRPGPDARSTAAATTSRSRTTGSPPAACSPARRSRSPRRRPPSGAARPAWRSTRTTTRPVTTSTTSTSRVTSSSPTAARTCWRRWPRTATCARRSRAARRPPRRRSPRRLARPRGRRRVPRPARRRASGARAARWRSTAATSSSGNLDGIRFTREGRPFGRPSCPTGGSRAAGRPRSGLRPARRWRGRGARRRS